MTNPNTQALSDAGVSIWLDDLSRELIETGKISELIKERNVVGVTSNPSIFQAALSKGDRYNDDLAALTKDGKDVEEVVFELTTSDVREACDLFLPLYESTKGVDGRVSIEVDPRLAHDTDKTVEQAKQLHAAVDRPNVLIKIPATKAGLPAITATIAEGISVNVTLIFSLERYRAVMNAYLEGLEKAHADGHDLSTIHSVASFFVSRVDTEIDKRLDAIGTDEARALKGKAGLANARLAYQAFEEVFSTPRWGSLAEAGANVQRPLWASTGVKDPAYPDTMYVDRARRRRRRQHDARQDARGDRRPRRHPRRHGDRWLRAGQQRPRRPRGASVSRTPRSSTCSRPRASTSSRRRGASCWTASPRRWRR